MSWWWPGAVVLLTLVVIAALVWWATQSRPPSSRPSGDEQRALSILDERLARGEIDPAEYEERRALLEHRN